MPTFRLVEITNRRGIPGECLQVEAQRAAAMFPSQVVGHEHEASRRAEVGWGLRSRAKHLHLETVPASGQEGGPHMLWHALEEIVRKIAKAHPGSLHVRHRRCAPADRAADPAVAARVLVAFWSGKYHTAARAYRIKSLLGPRYLAVVERELRCLRDRRIAVVFDVEPRNERS
jgi:hypothetical protein